MTITPPEPRPERRCRCRLRLIMPGTPGYDCCYQVVSIDQPLCDDCVALGHPHLDTFDPEPLP